MNDSASTIQRSPDPPVAGAGRVADRTRLWIILAGFALVLSGVITYSNIFQCPFIFDDQSAILHNVFVRRVWPLSYSLSAPLESTVAGRPLVCFTLALNYAIGGYRVGGYHAMNIAIHVFAAMALFGIVRRTILASPCLVSFVGASTAIAFTVSLLWLLHPLQTESVTYTIQRAESLCGLSYLLTLYCAVRAFQGTRSLGWSIGAVIACCLGMATKEVMVTAPFLVAVFDRIFFSPTWRGMIRRRGLFYLALASTWFVLAALIWGGPRAASAGFTLESSTPLSYALTQFGVILHYLRLSILPYPQCLDYDWPLAQSASQIVFPALVILALLSATIWGLRRKPAPGFLGVWFFVILAPTSSIIPIEDRAFEHRMYLPLAAVSALLVFAAFKLVRSAAVRWRLSDASVRAVSIGLVAFSAIACAALSHRRNFDYRTEVAIWENVVAQRPDNPRGYDSLGTAFFKIDRLDEAAAQYEKVLARWPDYPDSLHNMAMVLTRKGDLKAAAVKFRESIRFAPGNPGAHFNLGLVLTDLGELGDALFEFGEAIRLEPEYPEAHNAAGQILLRQGRLKEAADQYREAIYYKPEWPRVHNNLGNVLAKMGKTGEAIDHFREALRLQPGWAEVHSNLGIALAREGHYPDAIDQFRTAIRLKPNATSSYYNLAQALMKQGNVEEAQSVCRQLSNARPDDAQPLFFLGQLFLQAGRREEAIEQFRAALRINPHHRDAQARLNELTTTPSATTHPSS